MPPKTGKKGRSTAQPNGIHENGQAQKNNELRDAQSGIQGPEGQAHKQDRRYAKLKLADAYFSQSVTEGDDGEEEKKGGFEEGFNHKWRR
jgi:hypothetical protein